MQLCFDKSHTGIESLRETIEFLERAVEVSERATARLEEENSRLREQLAEERGDRNKLTDKIAVCAGIGPIFTEPVITHEAQYTPPSESIPSTNSIRDYVAEASRLEAIAFANDLRTRALEAKNYVPTEERLVKGREEIDNGGLDGEAG